MPKAPSVAVAATIPADSSATATVRTNTPSFDMITSSGSSCGLSAKYMFLREPSLYGPKTSFLRLVLTNISDSAVGSVNLEVVKLAGDDQEVSPFAEITKIEPGASDVADLYINFAGREGRPVRVRLSTDVGATEGDIIPPLGELVKPLEMTAEDFSEQQRKLGGMQETVAQVDNKGFSAETPLQSA